MNLKLISCGKFQIPEALRLDHATLRAELIKAATQPGQIGKAAERVAQLCQAHFAKEEENISRAFDLLHNRASGRVRPDSAAVAEMIVEYSAQHRALRDQHQSVNAAVEALLEEARKEDNEEITELVYNLRDHETIEDEVVYPTVLQIARSVQNGMRI